MIVKMAMRLLFAHPVRSAVLAAGFGTGVAVMAILLGVAHVMLEQAEAPALAGGGDVVISGAGAGVTAARVLLSGPLRTPPLGPRVRVASPSSGATLYIVGRGGALPVRARGGIPSLQRALGDSEVSAVASWGDSPQDLLWTSPDPAAVLRAIDAFRPVPDVPARAASWAEWLYFNGRSPAGRFYLTFLVGPAEPDGPRSAGVRLQLDRGRGVESFSTTARLAPEAIATAPELVIGSNRIRLTGLRYGITLDLVDSRGRRAAGELSIEGAPGQLMPPIEIRGAGGWRSGYVVPVMSGALSGTLSVAGEHTSFDRGVGYHDHNWGFWEGVSWQWGQVQYEDLSIVYGRVFPPRDAADPARIPGFLAAIGPGGPIGYATDVTIEETNGSDGSRPERIGVRARSTSVNLTLEFGVDDLVVNRLTAGPIATTMDFLQLRGGYTVTGTAGERRVEFRAPGSAETFRGR